MTASKSSPRFALRLAAALGALAACATADAAPGGYVHACASQISSGWSVVFAGDLPSRFTVWSPAMSSCDSGTVGGAIGALDSVAASHSGNNTSNSASGSIALGLLGLQAQNQSPGNVQFAIGAADGGWTDDTTVSINGQSGSAVWLFDVAVSGEMSAVLGGSAGFAISATKNGIELQKGVSGFNPGSGAVGNTDRQRPQWGVATYDVPVSYTVGSVVTFAVPITLGVSFTWGVNAGVQAGQRSMGSLPNAPMTSAELDFSHTVAYAGSRGVLINGVLYTDVGLASASGIDWHHAAAVPEPGRALLMLPGVLLLAALRRTRSERRRGDQALQAN